MEEWLARRRFLPDNTQHTQETDIHAPWGIRTHNSSNRAAAAPRLRPRGYWDRQQPHALDRAATGTGNLRNKMF